MDIDAQFLLPADAFFQANAPTGLTFDDVSLATRYSEVLPKNVATSVRLSQHIQLKIPFISADMDTVTGPEMASAMASAGGMGLLHYNMSAQAQIEAVKQIKQQVVTTVSAAVDAQSRLLCGVAIALPNDTNGHLDEKALCAHVEQLQNAGADAVAVSTAHGFSQRVGQAVRCLAKNFPGLTLIAGNVTSATGVQFLVEAGANVIKIGQGPGSICTTRIVAGVGIPQLTALYLASRAARQHNVTILADGGITKSGDIVKALTLADAVVCGGLLAGCPEAPGEIIEREGRRYKSYRGMGSVSAMKEGSAARYGHDKTAAKLTAEGVEALKLLTAPVEETLFHLAGGLRSGMGYLGAANLEQLKQLALYVRVTNAGVRESNPHDVVLK